MAPGITESADPWKEERLSDEQLTSPGGARRYVPAPMRPLPRASIMIRMSRTVLIVDDHGPYRMAARAMLEADGFTVVGEAATALEALAKVHSLKPAIVLLDVQLPDQDGFAVAERLAGAAHPPAVVLISSRSARTYETRLMDARALGFISKAQLTGPAIEALLRE